MPEFELHDHRGKPRRMRDGKPFRYSSIDIAKRAKRIFEVEKDCDTFYRIREVRPGGTVAITNAPTFSAGGISQPPGGPGGLGGLGGAAAQLATRIGSSITVSMHAPVHAIAEHEHRLAQEILSGRMQVRRG